jgi:hypothetical protein
MIVWLQSVKFLHLRSEYADLFPLPSLSPRLPVFPLALTPAPLLLRFRSNPRHKPAK